MRTQPLDHSFTRLAAAIRLPEASAASLIEDKELWYWTRSDSDQDRPNIF
jgi:hypothetical protein